MTLSTDPLSFVVCNKVRVLPDKRFLELGGEYSAKNRTFWYLDRAIDTTSKPVLWEKPNE
jgi:hypothetical protein